MKRPKMTTPYLRGPWRLVGPDPSSVPGLSYWHVLAKDPTPGVDHEVKILDHCSREADARLVTKAPELAETLAELAAEAMTEVGPLDVTVRKAIDLLKEVGLA